MLRAILDVNRARLSSMVLAGCAVAAVVGVASPAQASGTATGTATASATAASACPGPGGAQVAQAPDPQGEIKIFGHGWGHGMGMSQYGAQGAARLGCSYKTILTTYYSNTHLRRQSLRGKVLLTLASASRRSTVRAETGAVQWHGQGRTVTQAQGTTWTVSLSSDDGTPGAALLDGAGEQQLFVRRGSPLVAAHSGSVIALRPSTASSTTLRTRYDMARFVRTGDSLGVTEVITSSAERTAVQKYLAGLAEVPISWPQEALKAQVVAARTYLMSKFNRSEKVFKIKVTTADQVYSGYRRESDDERLGNRWRDAVEATDSQVILGEDGKPIEAMYSSSMGGYTENRQYVYGRYGISYLKAVDDSRWDAASDNPYRSWSRGFTKAQFASRLGFDSVTDWSIGDRGTEARADTGVTVTGLIKGNTVTKTFTGASARYRLGLRSPGFTFAAQS
jgi:stage II sporulation protein D